MGKRIVIGGTLLASLGLGAFAATGFGEGSSVPVPVTATSVAAKRVEGPAPRASAPAPRASLFRVIYKSTEPRPLPIGPNAVTIRSCPRGGAVLNGWFVRAGPDRSGVVAEGGQPDGTRRWSLVVDNTTGSEVQARFGIICLK
jgi:hypothetical protein